MSDITIENERYVTERKADSSVSAGGRWFVIYTKPRQEHIAANHLENQRFEVYLPSISVQKRKHHQIVDEIEPYFPRYLFVRFDEFTDDWGSIRSTRGVSSLVRFGGRPQAIASTLVEALLQNRNSDGFQIVADQNWCPGDQVDIEVGPFAGYRCIFEASKSSERVSVLLDIIGKQTRAVINKTDLAIPQLT